MLEVFIVNCLLNIAVNLDIPDMIYEFNNWLTRHIVLNTVVVVHRTMFAHNSHDRFSIINPFSAFHCVCDIGVFVISISCDIQNKLSIYPLLYRQLFVY